MPPPAVLAPCRSPPRPRPRPSKTLRAAQRAEERPVMDTNVFAQADFGLGSAVQAIVAEDTYFPLDRYSWDGSQASHVRPIQRRAC